LISGKRLKTACLKPTSFGLKRILNLALSLTASKAGGGSAPIVNSVESTPLPKEN
jgi:hypothetical protein